MSDSKEFKIIKKLIAALYNQVGKGDKFKVVDYQKGDISYSFNSLEVHYNYKKIAYYILFYNSNNNPKKEHGSIAINIGEERVLSTSYSCQIRMVDIEKDIKLYKKFKYLLKHFIKEEEHKTKKALKEEEHKFKKEYKSFIQSTWNAIKKVGN